MAFMREDGVAAPKYDDKEMFSFIVCHGGELDRTSQHWLGSCYKGGDIKWFDFCHRDYMSMIEMVGMAVNLGYPSIQKDVHDNILFWTKEVGCGDLVELKGDKDILNLAKKYIDSGRQEIPLYFEHLDNERDEDWAIVVRNGYEEVVQNGYDADDDALNTVDAEDSVADHDILVNDNGGPADKEVEKELQDRGKKVVQGNKVVNKKQMKGKEKVTEVRKRKKKLPKALDSSSNSDSDDSDPDFDPEVGYEKCGDPDAVRMEDDKLFSCYVDHDAIDNDPNLPLAEFEFSEDEYGTQTLTEYEHEDYSSSDFEDEYGVRKKKFPNYPVFVPDVDMKLPKFVLGLKFATADIFREAARRHSIFICRELYFIINDPNKVRVKCADGCPFVLHCSNVHGSTYLQIKTFNPNHNCGRSSENMHVTAAFLAKEYLTKLTNPKWDAANFQEEVNALLGVRPSRPCVYRARDKACALLEGTLRDQYAVLNDYAHELMRVNPGSRCIIKSNVEADGQVRFQRIYICLQPCKQGFLEGCRPIIGLDGTHVKGPHPGQILAAIGNDANNGMFPIAYAVVEIENFDSWNWFLKLLKEDLEIENDGYYCIMSDKQKGIIEAVKQLFPRAEHRHCIGHLIKNFQKDHKGLALEQQIQSIARATTIPWHAKEMTKMMGMSEAAHGWLLKRPANQWCRSHFGEHFKCDMLYNNMCEAFNKSILLARDKPILTCLERIRMYLMLLMASRRAHVDKWHTCVGHRIYKILDVNMKEGQQCIPRGNNDEKYQVGHPNGRTYVVDLRAHTCSCRQWQLSGIPCCHVCSAISLHSGKPEDFCHRWLKKEAYMATYKYMISPMSSQDQWEQHNFPPLIPPLYHNQPGRPRTKRRKIQGEEDKKKQKDNFKLARQYHTFFCGNCGGEGHTRVKCDKGFIKAARKRKPKPDKTHDEEPSQLQMHLRSHDGASRSTTAPKSKRMKTRRT